MEITDASKMIHKTFKLVPQQIINYSSKLKQIFHSESSKKTFMIIRIYRVGCS